jgi:hypothetical protein
VRFVSQAAVSVVLSLLVWMFTQEGQLKAGFALAGGAAVAVAALVAGLMWVAIASICAKRGWSLLSLLAVIFSEGLQLVLAASGLLILMFEFEQYKASHYSAAFLLLGFIGAVVASVLMFRFALFKKT